MEPKFRNKRGPMTDYNELIKKAKSAAEDLSPQMIEFCHAMMSARSGKEAAELAGYSTQTSASKASQLLSDERVQEYIGVLSALRSNAVALDATEIVSLQLRTYYECMAQKKLKEANTALEQLAKMKGLYNQSKFAQTNIETAEKQESEKKSEMENILDIIKSAQNRDKIQ